MRLCTAKRLRKGEGMDDPRSFSVRLVGLPLYQYKCIIVDLCVSKVHVLKLQLVFLVLSSVAFASSVRIRCPWASAGVSANGYEKDSQIQWSYSIITRSCTTTWLYNRQLVLPGFLQLISWETEGFVVKRQKWLKKNHVRRTEHQQTPDGNYSAVRNLER